MPLTKFLRTVCMPNPKAMASAPPANANTVNGIFTDTRLNKVNATTSITRIQRRIRFAWFASILNCLMKIGSMSRVMRPVTQKPTPRMRMAEMILPSVTLRLPVICWPSTVIVSCATNSSKPQNLLKNEPASENILLTLPQNGRPPTASRIPSFNRRISRSPRSI